MMFCRRVFLLLCLVCTLNALSYRFEPSLPRVSPRSTLRLKGGGISSSGGILDVTLAADARRFGKGEDEEAEQARLERKAREAAAAEEAAKLKAAAKAKAAEEAAKLAAEKEAARKERKAKEAAAAEEASKAKAIADAAAAAEAAKKAKAKEAEDARVKKEAERAPAKKPALAPGESVMDKVGGAWGAVVGSAIAGWGVVQSSAVSGCNTAGGYLQSGCSTVGQFSMEKWSTGSQFVVEGAEKVSDLAKEGAGKVKAVAVDGANKAKAFYDEHPHEVQAGGSAALVLLLVASILSKPHNATLPCGNTTTVTKGAAAAKRLRSLFASSSNYTKVKLGKASNYTKGKLGKARQWMRGAGQGASGALTNTTAAVKKGSVAAAQSAKKGAAVAAEGAKKSAAVVAAGAATAGTAGKAAAGKVANGTKVASQSVLASFLACFGWTSSTVNLKAFNHSVTKGSFASGNFEITLERRRKVGGLLVKNRLPKTNPKTNVVTKCGTRDYVVEVSEDGKAWAVAHTGWLKHSPKNSSSQFVSFKQRWAKYIRFKTTSSYSGGPGVRSVAPYAPMGSSTWLCCMHQTDVLQSVMDTHASWMWQTIHVPEARKEDGKVNLTAAMMRAPIAVGRYAGFNTADDLGLPALKTKVKELPGTVKQGVKKLPTNVKQGVKNLPTNTKYAMKRLGNGTVATAKGTASVAQKTGKLVGGIGKGFFTLFNATHRRQWYARNNATATPAEQEGKGVRCLPVAALLAAAGGVAAHTAYPEETEKLFQSVKEPVAAKAGELASQAGELWGKAAEVVVDLRKN